MNNSINDEVKFFNYLDAGVYAFKRINQEGNISFNNAVKNNQRAPKIKDINYSNAIIARAVLSFCCMQRLMTFSIKEQNDLISFDEIEKTKEFENFKNKLFKSDPALTGAACKNIFKQIRNTIAHGNISSMFNFQTFEKNLYEIYSICGSLSPKDKLLRQKLSDAIYDSQTMKVEYESNYEIAEDGTRIKRPSPIKKEIEINIYDIFNVMYNFLNSQYVETKPYIYQIFENSVEIENENGKSVYNFDEIQQENFEEIKNDFIEFYKNLKKKGIDILETALKKQSNMFAINGDSLSLPRIENFADFVAIDKILQSKDFVRIKAIKYINTYLTVLYPNCDKDSLIKMTFKNNAIIHHFSSNSPSELFLGICYANMDLNNVYKELLITETITLLQQIESNNLKSYIVDSDIFKKLLVEIYEKDIEDITFKEKIKIIDNIRNSFTHGNYINGVEDKIEIYDQISNSNKTLEHKFSIYTDELEEINEVCINTLTNHYNQKNKQNDKQK